MIQGQNEKRDFIRMTVESSIEFRRTGSPENHLGQTKDLSASGLRFTTAVALETGEVLEVVVRPGASVTPPLEAKLTVIRVRKDDPSKRYEVAGTLEH